MLWMASGRAFVFDNVGLVFVSVENAGCCVVSATAWEGDEEEAAAARREEEPRDMFVEAEAEASKPKSKSLRRARGTDGPGEMLRAACP